MDPCKASRQVSGRILFGATTRRCTGAGQRRPQPEATLFSLSPQRPVTPVCMSLSWTFSALSAFTQSQKERCT
jgi:hypothetical protein